MEIVVDGKTLNLDEFEDVLTEGRILRQQREKLGLTQQDVADRANITARQYQRFEAEERFLSSAAFEIKAAVCRALQLDLDLFCPPKD